MTAEQQKFATILIAEDNEISRELMAAAMENEGFNVVTARDGGEAEVVLGKNAVDLALVDINMSPKGGFEFVKHLVVSGIDLPVVIVTSDRSSDILVASHALGVQRVLHKPIDPRRLVDTVNQILRRRGFGVDAIGVEVHSGELEPQDIMKKTVELAHSNLNSGQGGPFAAIVTDVKGKIIGKGVNRFSSRHDPIAHAEVMAIRQAAEVIGSSDLSQCVLYCSSEPTEIGKALIKSVGIPRVYFGLGHEEIKTIKHKETQEQKEPANDPVYEKMLEGDVQALFENWQ